MARESIIQRKDQATIAIEGDRIVGTTHALGRAFLMRWTATRDEATAPDAADRDVDGG